MPLESFSTAAYEEVSRLLSLIHEGLFITDAEGTILSVGKLPKAIHGLGGAELVGRNVHALEQERIFDPSVTAAVLQQKRKVTLTQKGRDGRSYVVTGIPIINGAGQIERVVSFFRDITDYAALKSQYEHLEEQIFHCSAELRELRERELGDGAIVARSPQMTSPMKSAYPGVSTMFSLCPSYSAWSRDVPMEIWRAISSSMKSDLVLPSSTVPILPTAPAV